MFCFVSSIIPWCGQVSIFTEARTNTTTAIYRWCEEVHSYLNAKHARIKRLVHTHAHTHTSHTRAARARQSVNSHLLSLTRNQTKHSAGTQKECEVNWNVLTHSNCLVCVCEHWAMSTLPWQFMDCVTTYNMRSSFKIRSNAKFITYEKL